jgi:hypothetical protein
MFLCLIVATIFTGSCGKRNDKVIITDNPDPVTPARTCEGSPLGATRDQVCQSGYQGSILLVCTSSGWVERANSCTRIPGECEEQAEGKVNFDDHIKPLVDQYCMNCHAQNQLDTFPVAKSWASDTIRRLNLNPGNLEFMPKNANPLPDDDKRTWDRWRADGLLESDECADVDPGGNLYTNLSLAYVEREIERDLIELNDREDQLNSRYAVIAHKYNLRSSLQDMDYFKDAINKFVQSISQERRVTTVTQVDERGSIFRIDLESYKLEDFDWEDISDQDFLNFESFTVKGQLIKALTGARLPWLHADNLVFTGLGGNVCNANTRKNLAGRPCDPQRDGAFLYYSLLDFPINNRRVDKRFSDLVNLQIAYMDLNFFDEVQDFDCNFMGFNGSSISLNKNRLMVRCDTEEGRNWITYDTNSNDRAEQNVFEFPLLIETGGQAIYDFQASESIFTNKNGTDLYFLSDAVGNAADFAPLDTVFDNQQPGFDPTIRAAYSCFRCHSQGVLPATDQVRAKIIGIPSDLTVDDIEQVDALYQGTGPQTFINDNRRFKQAMLEMNIEASQPDPINYLTDRMRKDLNLAEVSAITFLTRSEFLQKLNQSVNVRNQIGQLGTGGTISFQQLVNVFPDLLDDFRLNVDPIDQ